MTTTPTILIGINSFLPWEAKFLTKVLDTYAAYTKYQPTVVLSTAYEYQYTGSCKVIINTPPKVKPKEYCYCHHQYLFDHYQDYDYVVSTDSDIVMEEKVMDYYVSNQGMSDDYIAGVLVYEIRNDGQKVLLSLSRTFKTQITDTVTIGSKSFIVPYREHSCLFIADKARFAKAIANGLSVTPIDTQPLTPCDWARTQIYKGCGMKKVVGVDDIINGSALVWHSTNKYQLNTMGQYPTPEEVFHLPPVKATPPVNSLMQTFMNEKPKTMRGLGDAVAVPAQAIAKVIDTITGHRTNIQGCGGCKRRQQKLNELVPFKQ